MIVILDTSTIIAALLSSKDNFTRYIFKLADLQKIQFVSSKETLVELKTVISSDKVKKYIRLRKHIVAPFINKYQHTAKFFKTSPKLIYKPLRDIKDNIFIQLAYISNADYLITGDKDLLILKKIGKTKIVKPKIFVEEFMKR